jgi:hypothetical protein
MSLIAQVASLQDSLAGYEAKDAIPWQVAELVNSLLEQSKSQLPDNPTLAVITPFEVNNTGSYASSGNIGSARAVLSQLYTLLPSDLGIA